jgi:hypothetical protein
VLVEDEKGQRFLPMLSGIVATGSKAEAQKVLRQWVDVRCQYKPVAKVVRVRVTVE